MKNNRQRHSSVFLILLVASFPVISFFVSRESSEDKEKRKKWLQDNKFLAKGVVISKGICNRGSGDFVFKKISFEGVQVARSDGSKFLEDSLDCWLYSGGFCSDLEIGDTVTFNTIKENLMIKKINGKISKCEFWTDL